MLVRSTFAPRLTGTLALLGALVLPLSPAAAQPIQNLRTPMEVSGFQRHTSHDEMWDYLLALRSRSTDMRLGSYGETREGRELPYAIFSRPLISTPHEAVLLGKPVVVLAANVHGGERTFRESLLILMREIATPGTSANRLLDDMVIIAAPQINPDGFEATPNGQRGNAWGIDLNRDYIKLEHPEIANYIGNLINHWNPHLYVDGHNGGVFPYNVTYQCPSHASPDQRITELCDNEIFPAIDRALEAGNYKSWYYNVGSPDEERWPVGGNQARIGRNYGGFANTVAILFESPGWQEREPGVRAGEIALRAVLDYVQQNPDRLITTVNRARRETIAMGLAAQGEVAVEMEYGPQDRRVNYEIGVGQGADRRAVPVTNALLMSKPVATKTRARPYAYVLPRDAVDAVAMLQRHGIVVEQLQDSARLEVQAYTVADVQHSPQYNHAATVQVTVGEVITTTRLFPRGTYVVPTGQVLGRVVAHMLEPETDDNVVYWNTMDAWLPRPRPEGTQAGGQGGGFGQQQGPPLVPIFKLMQAQGLPTKVVEP
ncbi:MAG TPA: M14 family zinc carboxypeptidase [Longimicrobiales bacterium]|nr:M14 family zinc carboxypeptidase [Longimicrobiales bacterium]